MGPQATTGLARIVLVLHQPSDVNNVGSVIRVMSNFGLRRLRLVEPAAFDPRRIAAIAHHCADLVATVERHATLEAALADCGWVVGTSRRPHTPPRPQLTPRQAAPLLLQAAAAHAETPVAVLFGREEDGLPRDALDQCHALVTIPTNAENASLNLAQAVLVVAYELWTAAAPAQGMTPLGASRRAEQDMPADIPALLDSLSTDSRLASGSQCEAMFEALGLVVKALQPRLRPSPLARAVARLRAVLLRAVPRQDEAAMLARWFSQIAARLQQSGGKGGSGQSTAPGRDSEGSGNGAHRR